MLNPAYEDSWEQAKELLDEHGFALLGEILTRDAYDELQAAINERTFNEEYEPALHRYENAIVPEAAHEALDAAAQKLGLPAPTRTQLRRYQTGSYTLQDDDEARPGYDYILFFCNEWDATQWRGEHTYAHPDEEALRAPPQPNALLVVKRDAETRKFVKRVTHHADNDYHAIEAHASDQ